MVVGGGGGGERGRKGFVESKGPVYRSLHNHQLLASHQPFLYTVYLSPGIAILAPNHFRTMCCSIKIGQKKFKGKRHHNYFLLQFRVKTKKYDAIWPVSGLGFFK